MTIPQTINGEKPYITGGFLKGQYVAEGVHFHWGSSQSSGSEHWINNKRYNAEMHIVHRNQKYRDINEALNYSDGIAVLGILMKIVHVSSTSVSWYNVHCFMALLFLLNRLLIVYTRV